MYWCADNRIGVICFYLQTALRASRIGRNQRSHATVHPLILQRQDHKAKLEESLLNTGSSVKSGIVSSKFPPSIGLSVPTLPSGIDGTPHDPPPATRRKASPQIQFASSFPEITSSVCSEKEDRGSSVGAMKPWILFCGRGTHSNHCSTSDLSVNAKSYTLNWHPGE